MEWSDFILHEQANQNVVAFKTIYADMTGDVLAGLMLSQIVYWHLPNRNGDSKLKIVKYGKKWLAKDYHDFYIETRLSRGQASRALKAIKFKGLIEVKLFKFDGAPTNHIRILENNFVEFYEKALENLKTENGKKKIQNSECTDPCIPLHVFTHSLTETTTETTKNLNTSDPLRGSLTPSFPKSGQKSENFRKNSKFSNPKEKLKEKKKTPLRETPFQDQLKKNKPTALKSSSKKILKRITKKLAGNIDYEYIKILNLPDYKIIRLLPEILKDEEKRDTLSYAIDNTFQNTDGGAYLDGSLGNKLINLESIIEKISYDQLKNGIEIAAERGNTHALSFLKGVLRKSTSLDL